MPTLSLMVHTIVSYSVSGILLAFLLTILAIKWGRLFQPKTRIRLMGMNLFLPIIGLFATGFCKNPYKFDSEGLQTFFALQCQLGNWAASFAGPLVMAAAGLAIFHLLCMHRSYYRLWQLPAADVHFDHDLEEVSARLAGQAKIKQPEMRYWPGNEVRLFTAGFSKPLVVISAGLLQQLTENELELALRHEFAHIKHRDTLKMLVVELFKDLLFFMPLVHWIGKIIMEETEKAADLAASHLSPATYAATLLKIYRLQAGSVKTSAWAPAFGGGRLTSRLEAILNPPKPSPWWSGVLFMGIIGLIVVYFLSLVC